jgi:hypothetical protein
MTVAYNQRQLAVDKAAAISFEERKHLQDSIAALSPDTLAPTKVQVAVADSMQRDSSQTAVSLASGKGSEPNSTLTNAFWTVYQLWEWIKMPTESSLSGIGTIFNYKNLAGKLLVGLSFLISFVLLINPRSIRMKKRVEILLGTDILLLLAYLVVSLLSSVSLRWGFWLLLILLFVQLYKEVVVTEKTEEENPSV